MEYPKQSGMVMQRFEWLESFVTGHDGIDARHRELFDACGTMIDHWQAGETAKCAASFERCADINRLHFEEEQVVLEGLENTSIKAHLEDHRQILKRLDEMQINCAKGCTGEACLSEVMHTIIRHLLKHDLEFQKHYAV